MYNEKWAISIVDDARLVYYGMAHNIPNTGYHVPPLPISTSTIPTLVFASHISLCRTIANIPFFSRSMAQVYQEVSSKDRLMLANYATVEFRLKRKGL
jgi:hypothetical protein